MTRGRLFGWNFGSFILELEPGCGAGETLGEVTEGYTFAAGGESADMAAVERAWETKLEGVYPHLSTAEEARREGGAYQLRGGRAHSAGRQDGQAQGADTRLPRHELRVRHRPCPAPRGAEPEILVIRNLSPEDVEESLDAMVEALGRSQMLVIPGGFSGGDEPDGSGKLINAFFRREKLADAVLELLYKRDGLALGICNGFQALIKLGSCPSEK